MSDTSSLSSLDSEEASRGPAAVKQSVENGQSCSLLDFPDELLVRVFDQVYQVLRSKHDGGINGPLVPHSQILFDKRIFSLTRSGSATSSYRRAR